MSHASLTIRAVCAEDETRWRELWSGYNDFYKRTIPEPVTANTFDRFLNSDVDIYCAVAVDESSKIVGFVTWFPHLSTASLEPTVYLNDLFVDPTIRTKGTGGRLMDHVFEHSRDVLVAKSVYWLTQHFNHAAQLLYVKKADKTDFVHYKKVLR